MEQNERSEAARRLASVMGRIGAAAEAAGRAPASVSLVAVSKQQPEARVAGALGAGQRLFGENRVQEAEARWPPFRERFADIRLHLIGPL